MRGRVAGSRRRFLIDAGRGAASLLALAAAPGWVACASRIGRPAPPDPALARAHAWLWRAQAADGRFASAKYGLLSSGQSLTPFVLDSLLAAPPALLASRRADVARCLQAAIALCDASGALGLRGPSLDYPCYATGLLLSCIGAALGATPGGTPGAPGKREAGWRSQAELSVAWLRTQQFRARDGWAGHPAQGGWGMGGPPRRRPPHAGHVDLSMTRRVVLGMRAAGLPATDPALVEARDFVARCQTGDGSFVYSPVDLALNKGLRAPDGSPRGYGSATTDGLLCLHALGAGSSEAGARALRWLLANHRLDRNPGVEGGPMAPFAEAMRGYYRAGAARCFALLEGPPGWQSALQAALVAEQHVDGSFLGTNGLQREDDPLIATAFAVQALGAAGRTAQRGRAR